LADCEPQLTDVYACGCVLFAMIFGMMPFYSGPNFNRYVDLVYKNSSKDVIGKYFNTLFKIE